MSRFELKPQVVVVTGCQRSGTTLVAQLLGAHPHAVLIDEPDEVYRWTDAWLDETLDASLHREILTKAAGKYRDADRRFSADGVLADGITHLILKAPNLAVEHARLAALAQRPTIVFPVRDPRAVVASILALHYVDVVGNQAARFADLPAIAATAAYAMLSNPHAEPATRAAAVWEIKTSAFDAHAAAGLDPFVFRYEDLVQRPAWMRRQLLLHVGLRPQDLAAEPERLMQGDSYGGFSRERALDDASLDIWRKGLSEAQLRCVERAAAGLGTRLGYFGGATAGVGSELRPLRERPPVIFTGRGGSGTRMLSALAQACGVWLGTRLNGSADSVDWVDLHYRMVEDLNPRRPLVLPGHWSAAIQAEAGRQLAAAPTSGEWGWKLPESIQVLPELLQALPKSKLVVLVRDPVSSSLRRTHLSSRLDNPVGTSTLAAAYRLQGLDPRDAASDPDWLRNAVSWNYQMGQFLSAQRRNAGRHPILVLRYEDLCRNPRACAERLSRFLGTRLPDDLSLPEIDPARTGMIDPDDPRIGKIWALCGTNAEALGYRRPQGLTSAPETVRGPEAERGVERAAASAAVDHADDDRGICPICEGPVTFQRGGPDLRNRLVCPSCTRGSIPRERAIALELKRCLPDWRARRIHESSPVGRGLVVQLRRECPGYVVTQFFPGEPLGAMVKGVRNENLEAQTFADEQFDAAISLDVLEHVEDPRRALLDTARTLKPGGYCLLTTPTFAGKLRSERRAHIHPDGRIDIVVGEAEYHGNPVNAQGALVTFHYGYDLAELIYRWTGMSVEVVRRHDPVHGVVGQMTEVYVCRKPG